MDRGPRGPNERVGLILGSFKGKFLGIVEMEVGRGGDKLVTEVMGAVESSEDMNSVLSVVSGVGGIMEIVEIEVKPVEVVVDMESIIDRVGTLSISRCLSG